MDNSEKSFRDKALSFVRANFLIVALFSFGLTLLGIGLIQLLGGRQSEIEFERGEDLSREKHENASIFVDVSGSVIKPGIYRLPDESRIQDALIAAGGLSQDADRDYIAKTLNLAQKLTDGTKLYIPSILEANTGVAGIATSKKSKININNATAGELDSLWGIGPATAEKVIDARPYGSIEELLTKKIVSQKVFDKIKDEITVY